MTKKQLLILVAIVLLTFLFWGATFFLKDWRHGFSAPANNEILSINTSNWLTYENGEFGYRFKHPQDIKILSGEDPSLGFVEPPKGAVYILFSTKYPNIKALNPSDPSTFLDFKIGIVPLGDASLYGKTIDEIVKNFVGQSGVVKTVALNGKTIAVYDDGARVYLVEKGIIYNFYLEGLNPQYKYAQDWLRSINNTQLVKDADNYPTYVQILEGIYSTFEIL